MDVPCCVHFMRQRNDVYKIENFLKKIKDSKAKPDLTNEAAITNQTESDQKQEI